MAIPLNEKKIRQACLLHWNGDLLKDIAILLDVNPNTLTRWRKTQIWKDFEAELLKELPNEMGVADTMPRHETDTTDTEET